MDDLLDVFLPAARAWEEQILRFLQDLVRIPSVNGRENEGAVVERVLEEAKRLDLDGFVVAPNPERPNALVRWGTGSRGFALVAHLDTVAEGQAPWKHPPFAGLVEEGRLYGRGAADNKAGMACSLYTLALLRDKGVFTPEEVSLIAAGVADEESGASSPYGMRALIDGGHLPVQGAIYTYTSDIVCVGHRGLIRLEIEARGRSVHTGSEAWSRGEEGANAVTGLAAVLLALEEMALPEVPPNPLFAGLGAAITPGTLIEGGDFESMVPSRARAVVDIRLLPGQAADEVLQAVDAVLSEVADARAPVTFSYRVKNNLPGVYIPGDHRLAVIAQEVAREATGASWPKAIAGPANEGYMLIQAGIPTLCGFGPEGGNAHAPDEWVAVDSLARTVAVFAGVIHEYLKTQLKGTDHDA